MKKEKIEKMHLLYHKSKETNKTKTNRKDNEQLVYIKRRKLKKHISSFGILYTAAVRQERTTQNKSHGF